ncbi:MAG TPA: DUF692 family protein [Thermoanaerobaculia bacterium]
MLFDPILDPHPARRIPLGTTWNGGDDLLLHRMQPLVDFVEATPDTLARKRDGRAVIPGETIEALQRIAATKSLLVHGVGLSIGSHDGWSTDYLALLDQLFDAVPIRWHSEHLGYTRVDGLPLGTMLTLPRTGEALDLVCRRIEAIQERYPVPFLIENVVGILPEPPSPAYGPAGFLNEITRRTGCGLVLDVYNLECDARNQRLDLPAFFDELDFRPVRELHIANGVERDGVLLDVHSRRTREETRQLLDLVLHRAPNVEVVVYELLPQAVQTQGHDAIIDELELLRARWS